MSGKVCLVLCCFLIVSGLSTEFVEGIAFRSTQSQKPLPKNYFNAIVVLLKL